MEGGWQGEKEGDRKGEAEAQRGREPQLSRSTIGSDKCNLLGSADPVAPPWLLVDQDSSAPKLLRGLFHLISGGQGRPAFIPTEEERGEAVGRRRRGK